MGKSGLKKIAISIWIVIGILVAVVLFAPSSSGPDISKAKPYSVFNQKDLSVVGRNRLEWWIQSPEAKSFEERAQTAMKAAIDLQKKNAADFVNVWLEINPTLAGKGYQLAIARYAPDGKGISGTEELKWEVEAADVSTDSQEIAIGDLWYKNRDSFLRPDGLVDEPRIMVFIAKKLHISPDQVHLPWFTRKGYPVQQ